MSDLQKKLLIIVAVSLGGTLLFFAYEANKRAHDASQRTQSYGEALNTLVKSDKPNYEDAIAKLQKSLSFAIPNSPQEGPIKIDLAVALHERDLEGHQVTDSPFLFLKEVALNEKYSENTRARALRYIAAFLINADERIAREVVFTGPVFQDLLTDDNILIGIAKIFELSITGGRDESSLRIADLYANELLMDATLTLDQKNEFFKKVEERLAMGKKYIGKLEVRDVKDTQLLGYYHRLGLSKRLQADILGKLYLLTSNHGEKDKEAVTALYKEALTDLAQEPSYINKKMEMYVRFDYAQWITEAYGSSHMTEIKSILDPIYAEDNKLAMGVTLGEIFINQKKLVEKTQYYKRAIIELARVDSRMKDVLMTQFGWAEQDFHVKLPPLRTYNPS